MLSYWVWASAIVTRPLVLGIFSTRLLRAMLLSVSCFMLKNTSSAVFSQVSILAVPPSLSTGDALLQVRVRGLAAKPSYAEL